MKQERGKMARQLASEPIGQQTRNCGDCGNCGNCRNRASARAEPLDNRAQDTGFGTQDIAAGGKAQAGQKHMHAHVFFFAFLGWWVGCVGGIRRMLLLLFLSPEGMKLDAGYYWPVPVRASE